MWPKLTPSFYRFLKQFPLIKVSPGENLVRPWDQVKNVIYITSGFLRIYSLTPDGKEVTLTYLNPAKNKHLAYGPAHSSPNTFIEAATEVQLHSMPRKKLIKFLHNNPDNYISFIGSLIEQSHTLFRQLKWLKIGSAYLNTTAHIYFLFTELGNKNKNEITIDMPVTHQTIANLTGLTRETVTAQIKRLKRKGLIKYQKKMLITTNLAALKDEIDALD